MLKRFAIDPDMKTYYLLPIGGQSNCVGTAIDGTTLTNTDLDSSILINVKAGNSEGGGVNYPTTGWPSTPPHDSNLEITNFSQGATFGGFGPERGLARTLAAAGHNVCVVKVAFNGHGLGQHWMRDTSQFYIGNYQMFVDLIGITKAELESQGHRVIIPAIFWPQYYSDANSLSLNTIYQSNLTQFTADLREDLGMPNLPFITMDNPPWSNAAYLANADAQKAAFVASDVNAYSVVTSDLDHIGDNVHLTSEAKETIGIRMADLLRF